MLADESQVKSAQAAEPPQGAKDFSPWREPWESGVATVDSALEGRKKTYDSHRPFAPAGARGVEGSPIPTARAVG